MKLKTLDILALMLPLVLLSAVKVTNGATTPLKCIKCLNEGIGKDKAKQCSVMVAATDCPGSADDRCVALLTPVTKVLQPGDPPTTTYTLDKKCMTMTEFRTQYNMNAVESKCADYPHPTETNQTVTGCVCATNECNKDNIVNLKSALGTAEPESTPEGTAEPAAEGEPESTAESTTDPEGAATAVQPTYALLIIAISARLLHRVG